MKTLKIISIFLLFSFGSSAQNISKDTTEIKSVLADFFQVFTVYDIKHFEQNCSPDFILYENGEVWSPKIIREYVEKARSEPKTSERVNEFHFINFNIKGNVAWAAYHNTAHITLLKDGTKRDINWLESIILEKIKGKWRLVQMHSTKKK
jgi:SnoaL-like domain